jgi:hypothetical protein
LEPKGPRENLRVDGDQVILSNVAIIATQRIAGVQFRVRRLSGERWVIVRDHLESSQLTVKIL